MRKIAVLSLLFLTFLIFPVLATLYDISEATYIDYLDISSQDTEPSGIAFNNDGTKLYVVGDANDKIYEYNLSAPYDISTGTYNDNLSVSSQDSIPTGIAFNNDGTKLYVVGSSYDCIYEYNLSAPYDISTGTYNDNLSVSSQDTEPSGIVFNNDGTKLYVVGYSNYAVYEYNLSAPYDISTGTYNDNLSVSSQDSIPTGIAFNNDGTKLYVVGVLNMKIYEYNLNIAYDVSTGIYVDSLYIANQDTDPQGIAFNNNGNKLYMVGRTNDNVNEYNIPPDFSITLNSPLNQTTTDDTTPDFNFTVSGEMSLYNCSLYLNDTLKWNSESVSNNTDTIATSSNLLDGTYNWYINCTAGGATNQSEIREITIDTVAPSILNQQISTNYYNGTVNLSDTNFVTDKKQIKVNVSASDANLDSVWARVYNSITDYLMSLISETIYGVNINLDKGSYNISSFANDTAGNQNNTANQSVTVSDLDLSSYITVSDYKWDSYKDIIANSTVNKVKWINDTGTSLPYKLNILGYYVNGDSCKVNDVSYSVLGGICDYTHTINKDSVYSDLEFYDSNYGNGTPVTQTLGAEQTPTSKWYRNVTLNYYLPNGSTAPQGTFTNSTTLALCVDSTVTADEYIKYYNGTDFVDITPSTSGSWEKKTVGSKTFYVIKDDFCNGDGIMDFKVKVELNS